MLKPYHGHPAFRQLVDETQDPPALVLEYLDGNALDASNKRLLNALEVKQTGSLLFVTRESIGGLPYGFLCVIILVMSNDALL
jgi:hypothetical protein